MKASADEVMALLRAVAASGDDWLSVQESSDGGFRIVDPSGAVATVDLAEYWVDVRAAGAVGVAGLMPAGAAPAPDSLIRVTVSGDLPPVATVTGRVYLDGFSLHALMVVARDVLRVAGAFAHVPRAAEAPAPSIEPAPDLAPAALSDDRSDETETPSERGMDAEPAVDRPPSAEPGAPEHPEATVAMPIEAAMTPVPGAVPDEANGASLQAAQPDEAVRPTEGDATARERGSPIVPTKPSSVGATVQIPRDVVADALGLDTTIATPPEAETKLVCRRCGEEVQPGERYCIACGAPQPGTTSAGGAAPSVARRYEPDTVIWRRPGPGAAVCPRCGQSNPESNRYCQGCGSALRDE